ncbi:cache domain-containing protein [Anaeromyxobacter oryzae]|uniref:histidine kinase n=1 Tax=Anaeromyxobacter oryzae TaxID=2918170 RepID=A0ABN6MRU6_9BACT|nr:cache domain-containing protein [Anaeromyxobacter oryzae]BDG02429.1 histidine kinase [Anaeromyxobacter oryzae]
MKSLSALSIRVQLTLLAAIFVLPAAGIIVWSGLRSREEKIQEARVETQKLAAAIAAAYESRLAAAQQLMTALANLPAVKARDPAVQHLLRDMVALNPDYANISIADAAGDVWASANPGRFNIADRRHFQGALATGRLASGESVTGRVTSRPTFFFGYPFRDARGEIAGVISVGFDLRFVRLLESSRLPPRSSFSLTDRNGIVVARAIDAEPYVGRPISPALLAAMVDGPDEATNIGPSLTGEYRVQTYRKLRLAGEQTPFLYVRAGIPYAGVIAGANRALARNVALLLSFFLAALAFASVVGKRTIVDRIARLESASHRLAGGDLGVRVGELVRGGELGRLGRSFDRMAEQLARREKALQESERNLLQAQKMETVGRLAGGIAHDFNNQLTAILSNSEHLARALPGDEGAIAGDIRDAALRSARLVNQLLAFARKGPSRVVAVDLHRTVDEVVGLLSRSIDKRIQLRTRLEAAPALVRGDPDRLHTALVNLALNARDAMPDGGTITFETRRVELDAAACAAVPFDVSPGPYLEVRVVDTGIGLSEEVRAHLFEPFFTTKGVGMGSVLGLAEVYGTVKTHQGAITVESAADRGTSFALLLPAVDGVSPEPRSERTQGRPTPTYPLRVLIADDEQNVRISLGLLLRTGGHEVIECANGAQAVRTHKADARRIDVVILDMMMPDMSGREVLAKIREVTPDVPVIVSSGFSKGPDVEALRGESAVFYLAKPYTTEQLERALAKACNET